MGGDAFYQGPMAVEQLPANELERMPLDNLVTPYHQGFYEEMPTRIGSEEMPAAKPAAKKSDPLEHLTTHLFKRPAHEDFPTSEPYHGPFAETGKRSELDGEPIGSLVTVYSTGRSDEPPRPSVAITPDYDVGTAAEMFEPKEILSRVELQKEAIELSAVEGKKGKKKG
jgi:hypothetical protein